MQEHCWPTIPGMCECGQGIRFKLTFSKFVAMYNFGRFLAVSGFAATGYVVYGLAKEWWYQRVSLYQLRGDF
jgi:hypothetical protein